MPDKSLAATPVVLVLPEISNVAEFEATLIKLELEIWPLLTKAKVPADTVVWPV